VIAHAMERVTGKKLANLISEELWQTMGAEEDANITVDSSGYGLSCGGISSSLRDFARFGILHLNDGMLNGKQIIPRDWIKTLEVAITDWQMNLFAPLTQMENIATNFGLKMRVKQP